MVRAADLRVCGEGTVTAGSATSVEGELAVFCRPVVTASAVVRRDGSVLAEGWLPDFVRLGKLERHLGDGVIEEIVAAALEQGRLRKRQRRRVMSYPLVIRLMIAMTLTPDGSYCQSLARLAGLLADVLFVPGMACPDGESSHGNGDLGGTASKRRAPVRIPNGGRCAGSNRSPRCRWSGNPRFDPTSDRPACIDMHRALR